MSRAILFLIMIGNFAFLLLFILPAAPKGLESMAYLTVATRLRELDEAGVIAVDEEAACAYFGERYSAVSMIAGKAAQPAARSINKLCVGLMAIAALNGLAAIVGLLAWREGQPGPIALEPDATDRS
jgi:hypothetical protein